MGVQKFKEAFGKAGVPQILKDFIAFAEKQDDFFAGDFELDPGTKAIIDTYDGYDKKKKVQFFFFGSNGDGSGFAIWHYDVKAGLEDSPVTFWDSEGQANIVVAANFKEFLSILATDGSFSSGYFIEKEEDTPGNKAFKKWLKEKYKIAPIKDPNALIVKAQKSFPLLDDWFNGKESSSKKTSTSKPIAGKDFTTWADYFKNNPDWFNIVGKPIEEHLPINKMKVSSYDKEKLYYEVLTEGINICTNKKGNIRSIQLTIKKDDPKKSYKGNLPTPINLKMKEKEVVGLLGKPSKQNKSMGWIRYDKLFSYVLRIEFGKDGYIDTVSVMDPAVAP